MKTVRSLVFLAAALRADEPKLKTLTVCELLRDLATYQHKVVAVRGELMRGEEHFYLQGDRCSKKLVTSGFVWPDAINLEQPGSPFVETPVLFKLDLVSMNDLALAIQKATAGGESVRIWATFVGKLETREHLEVVRTGTNKLVGYGFGHLNAFPAQVVYERVRDVTIKRDRPSTHKR